MLYFRRPRRQVRVGFLNAISALPDLFLEQALQVARISLSQAQKETQDAFMRYTACMDVERQARQAVTTAEKRRDDISMCH